MRETLRDARNRLNDRVAFAHLDPATGDLVAGKALADELVPLILPLLRLGGVLVSEPTLAVDGLNSLSLPAGVEPGRYNLYRRVSH
jgi:hypothetical protein